MRFFSCYVILSIFAHSLLVADEACAANMEIEFAIPYSKNSVVSMGAAKFADAMRQVDDGITIKIVTSEASVPVLDAVRKGLYDLAAIPSGFLVPTAEELALFELPFLFRKLEEVAAVQRSDVGTVLLSAVEKSGLIGLGFWNSRMTQIMARVPIRSIEDLKGLKVRSVASSFGKNLFSDALGATTVNVPRNEIHTALSRGRIDGFETSYETVPEVLDKLGSSSVAGNYFSRTNHRPLLSVVVANRTFWEEISYKLQFKIVESVRNIEPAVTELAINAEKAAQKSFEQNFSVKSVTYTQQMERAEILQLEKIKLKTISKELPQLAYEAQLVIKAQSRKISPNAGHSPQKKTSVDRIRKIFFATDRLDEGGHDPIFKFGSKRSPSINLGIATVTIPDKWAPSQDVPSVCDPRSKPRERPKLKNIREIAASEYLTLVHKEINKSDRQSVLLFVHGFCNSFEDAAIGAALVAENIQFRGAVLIFSWPTMGNLFRYTHDSTSARQSRDNFRDFIDLLRKWAKFKRLHILAHSMGARIVSDGLENLYLRLGQHAEPFLIHLVLAAPDVDSLVFTQLVPPMNALSNHFTMYVSSEDRALKVSQLANGFPRAGDATSNIVIVSGLETIDVSNVDTGFIGHSYISDSEAVAKDLIALIRDDIAPDNRTWLDPQEKNGEKYWAFSP